MTPEKQREQIVQNIAGMLMSTPFTFEFKVMKKPNGIKIVYEVTQEKMDAMMNDAATNPRLEKEYF